MTPPCASPECPALATRGDYCPVHATVKLRAICAWCAVELSPGIEPVSHGICKPCAGNFDMFDAEEAEGKALAVEARERIARMYRRTA